ncbi:MAG: NAD(FAD)-utilizing dehydrogenase [Actinomycetia bacterium]|nr:NAD(FAD)-utilizing dehydrogenase [Actinomycetes bacterium]
MVRATVVGGGPGGLMAAEVLATARVAVTVLERMPSVGRKLLLAGRGGLNLTHTEGLEAFLDRYGPARPRLEAAIRAFDPDDLRAWAAGLGQETFVGSSGRVFPEAFRATPLLRAWLGRLDHLGVEVRTRTAWTGWGDDADVTVLALGGASWPRVGSDGAWVGLMGEIEVAPLRPANCGFVVAWTGTFRDRFAGTPLKNVELSGGGGSARGDAVVTRGGIEGGAVYALAAGLRDEIAAEGHAVLAVDLRPDATVDVLAARLEGRPKESTANVLRRAGIDAVGAGLAREATGNELPDDPAALAALLKAVPVRLVRAYPLARAISTAGGIAFDEVDDDFMLRRRPGTFVAGEMLDWEAPTGGYLLQATFSTAVAAAHGALRWLAR